MTAAAEIDREKRAAAQASAQLVADGMMVGLGTGSTVAYLLPALAARRLEITCVSTSPATTQIATELGLTVVSFEGEDAPAQLDIAIDGADQVAPSGWLVKGGGGAHTREKLVTAAADRFVVIVNAEKMVQRIGPPVPVELARFGLAGTLARLPDVRLRGVPDSPDGGVIGDYFGAVDDPAVLAERLSTTPGVVDHGLFAPAMVSDVLVGREDTVEHITITGR